MGRISALWFRGAKLYEFKKVLVLCTLYFITHFSELL